MNRMTGFFSLIIFAFMLVSCTGDPTSPNTLTKAEKEEGWELLFDGKSMDKWRSYLKDEVEGWTVEEGTMKAPGLGGDKGGDIITREQFENFELALEWKIAPEGNSGILYMVHESDTMEVYETGPEYQLLDDAGFPDPLEDYQKTGANYAMHVAENKELKPVGEWNTSRIVVNQPHVEHWLNGRKVVAYELWSEDWKKKVESGKWSNFPEYGKYQKGHIALQDHGSLAWFRNIKIRRL